MKQKQLVLQLNKINKKLLSEMTKFLSRSIKKERKGTNTQYQDQEIG